MSTYKTYISFVVQNGDKHIHDFAIAELSLPKYAFYADNTSQQVVEWADQKQKQLKPTEKLIILNFFNVSNIK